MRIAMCQINPVVGDLEANAAAILSAAQQAQAAGAALAVYPELAICGYPPRDLLDRPSFLSDAWAALQALAQQVPPELSLLVGGVEPFGDGARAYNVAALLRDGQLRQVVRKRLLPSYDVFDETRYFEAGSEPGVVQVAGRRIGVTICEDAWNAVASPLRRPYPQDPVQDCVDAGAELLVNLSASPFTRAKYRERERMLAAIARTHGRPLIFVNQVGGNDDLLFDGGSSSFDPQGQLLGRAASFGSEVSIVSLEGAPGQPAGTIASNPSSEAAAVLEALTMGVRDYARKTGFTRAVLGLSGGIDSALVACIAARALGPDHVLGVSLPSRYSSQHSLDDARALAENLGLQYRVVPIEPLYERFADHLSPVLDELGPAPQGDTSFENLQARMRGVTLMALSNRLGHLLLTTGNKSELAVGYCTLYGDMAGGLAVINDLPKTFVYEVSREVNRQAGRSLIPDSSLTKPPSAELRPDQTDQDSLPPYPLLDAILERYVEQARDVDSIVAEGYDADTVQRVARMVQTSEYKRRQLPPGLIVSGKAFGPGRRYPIAQRYRR